jgi:serine/threonine protein kinase
MDRTTTTRIDGPATLRDRRPALIAGRYEVDLDNPLGSGGMAVVYRGRDLRTRRPVAMRTLRIEYRQDPAIRARFRHETRLQAFASHPNIARVFDLHEDGDAPWAVHELVHGTSLRDLLEEHGPFNPDDIANVLDQLAGALSHLHQGGLVHLDVTPRNVLITGDGMLKLVDFGLAQRAGTVQESIGGATFGTAAYLAPEQATGEPVSPPTDIYALGCVIYELLTGRPPFSADDGEDAKRALIDAHLRDVPLPPSHVTAHVIPEALDDVVLWALVKDPGHRYQEVDAFARLFRAAVEGDSDSSARTTTPVVFTDVPEYRPTRSPDAIPRPAPAQQVEWFTEDATHIDPSQRSAWTGPYRLLGRLLRRTGWIRRLVWRLTVFLVIANLFLAVGILLFQGPAGLLARAPALQTGSTATVIEDGYTIRAGAGLDEPPLRTVSAGERLVVTGPPISADGLRWWPIQFDGNGQAATGFIAEDGIEPAAVGISDRLLRAAERRFDELRADAESWLTGE